MKPPPPLHVELKTSRCACALIVGSHAATLALVFAMPLAPQVQAMIATGVAAACAAALARAGGRRAIASLRVGLDRSIRATARDGTARGGLVLADTCVGARVTTIVWRPDGARWPRTLLLLPDALAVDDFRRLRVALRYGRVPGAEPGTNEVDAG